jgi:hypothetical protein
MAQSSHAGAARRIAVALCAAMICLPAPVAAQESGSGQGNDSVAQGSGIPGTGEPERSREPKAEGGTLPLTGLDVLALAAVALALSSTGFALRRLTAPPGP